MVRDLARNDLPELDNDGMRDVHESVMRAQRNPAYCVLRCAARSQRFVSGE
jgi:hypothetical protein